VTAIPIEIHLTRFVDRLSRDIRRLEKTSLRMSRARMGIFLVGVISVVWASEVGRSDVAWTLGFLISSVFIIVMMVHSRIARGIRRRKVYVTIKSRHLARLRRSWKDLPYSGADEADLDHPFEADLDLYGAKSLHHLIDTAFSREGSERLHQWLVQMEPDPEATLWRQRLIGDLIPLTGFRDRVSLLTSLVLPAEGGQFRGQVLLDWLRAHKTDGRFKMVLVMLSVLAVLTPLLLTLKLISVIELGWWTYSLGAYIIFYLVNFRLYAHLFDEAEHLYEQFEIVMPVFGLIESFQFRRDSTLAEVAAPLKKRGALPSRFAKRVMRLAMAASAQRNDVFRIVANLIMPWELLFAYLLERTKSDLANILPEWLEALQVLEAGSSLATFAGLNPDYTFPQFVKSDTHSGMLSCVEMGHPLLAREECVVNDFKIDGLQHLDLVTGSNMSGKSTFLRTVGINLALANSGGPVHARAMQVIPLRLYTCIRVADSVNDGISFFYAEVRRLKKMLSELEAGSSFPLLYFIDEVFRGTNNRERLIGSRELLHQMSALNGSGMVSTHDLDLTKLADEMAGVTNYHFREHIEGREMHFDYKLHPGPSPTTNALKIMELEGLISENRTPRTVR